MPSIVEHVSTLDADFHVLLSSVFRYLLDGHDGVVLKHLARHPPPEHNELQLNGLSL